MGTSWTDSHSQRVSLPKKRKSKPRLTSEILPSCHGHQQRLKEARKMSSQKGTGNNNRAACLACVEVHLPGPSRKGPAAGQRGWDHRACCARAHQDPPPLPSASAHTHPHLAGNGVTLTGKEPRVLTPVVGSEVQDDPEA